MSPITPANISRELTQALVDADLIRRCDKCVKAKGLCGPCLEREGPKLKRSSIWFMLMGKRDGSGCPKCGCEVKVEAPEDGSMWMVCTGFPELCKYQLRIETKEERKARERYEAKSERRAQALARATASANVARRASRAREFSRARIPVQRVA